MKVDYVSDVHLEFGRAEFKPEHTGEVLVLAGDVCMVNDIDKFPLTSVHANSQSYRSTNSNVYREFFLEASKRYKHVLYVMGNHEHYKGTFDETVDVVRAQLSELTTNIHVLSNETFEYEGVTFFGATFWTDMNKSDYVAMHYAQQNMSDFRLIRWGEVRNYRKLHPKDTVEQFEFTKRKLRDVVRSATGPVVVISHHAPCSLSVHEMYRGDDLNAAYCSSVIEEVLDFNVPFWVHGHMHNPSDYVIENTRVLCNPRGYFKHEHFNTHLELKSFNVATNV